MKLIYKIMALFTAVLIIDGCNGDDAGSSSTVVSQKSSVVSEIDAPATSSIEAEENFDFSTEKEIKIIISSQQSLADEDSTTDTASTDDTSTGDQTAATDTSADTIGTDNSVADDPTGQVVFAPGALHIYADLARAFADGSIAPDPRSRITTIHPHLIQEVSFMVNKNIEVIYAHWIPSDIDETEKTWAIVLNKDDDVYEVFL